MRKTGIVFAAAIITLCAAGAMAHTKKKAAAPPAPAVEAGAKAVKHSGMTAEAALENAAAHDAGVAEEKEEMNLVLWLGALTALSLLSTAFFSIFRVPAAGWMSWHRRSAYFTLCLMLIHGSLALYGHFFG